MLSVANNKSAAILEQALVTLFKLVENQWAMFESREDSLLDRLLLLRTIANHTVSEPPSAVCKGGADAHRYSNRPTR